MSLDIDRGGKNEPSRFTVVGLWGKYIFKPESPKYRELPQLEDLTMKMADIAKIKTVPHTLIKLADGEFGYLTKRVDRTADGKPLSMLDMCQLSNRLTEHKYDGTYVQLADVVLKYSVVPLLDVQRFWEIVIFSDTGIGHDQLSLLMKRDREPFARHTNLFILRASTKRMKCKLESCRKEFDGDFHQAMRVVSEKSAAK